MANDPSSIVSTPAAEGLSIPAAQTLSTPTLQSLMEAGGPVIMLLLIMSIVASTLFLVKFTQFLWVGLNRQNIITKALQHWHGKRAEHAIATLNNTRHPVAPVLQTAMRLQSQAGVSNEMAREETLRIAKAQLANARSHLRIIEVIATLSPLLGLLGTVLGMIEAFQKLEGSSTIDPSVLSGGIWEALLTTAAGLVVAIPAVMALNWLEQSIERFKQLMEDAMTQVFTTEAIGPVAITQNNTPKKPRVNSHASTALAN